MLGAPALEDLRRTARAAFDRGDDDRLERACRDILKRSPEDSEARRLIGRQALRDARPLAAEPWFREAAARAPDAPGAWTDLARSLIDQRRDAEAEAILSAAAARGVRSANLLTQLGFLHGALGARDAARSSFETAVDLDPTFADAYRGLAFAGGLSEGEPDRRAAERTRAKLKPADPLAIAIDFALADIDARAGRPDAFDRLKAANAAQYEAAGRPKDASPPSPRRIAANSAPDSLRDAAKLQDAALTPVFVLGPSGSGVELIEAVLAAHSLVFGADQSSVAAGPMLRAVQEAAGRPGAGAAQLLDAPPAALSAGGQAYLDRMAPLAGEARWVVDAALDGLSLAPLLAAVLPQARFVVARRAAFDAGWASWRTPSAQASAHLCDLASYGKYARRVRGFEDALSALLGPRLLTVDAEALTNEPDRGVRALLDALGLEAEAACMRVAQRGWCDALSSPRAAGRCLARDPAGSWRPWAGKLQPLRRALRDLAPAIDA